MKYLSICENDPNSQLGDAERKNSQLAQQQRKGKNSQLPEQGEEESQLAEPGGKGSELPELMFMVVGSDYRAGAKSDKQLADALGTDFAYSANLPATLDALSTRSQHPWFAPNVDGQVSCVFEVNGVATVTVGLSSDAHAGACALHFLVINYTSALT